MATLDLKDVRVLVMGLGLHGGGVATVKWLIKKGARVTVTDLRSETVLAPSVKALSSLPVRFVLGRHDEDDFRTHDIVVVNPGVPRESKYLAIAHKSGTRIENVASLFFHFTQNPVIGITGTRGKTTTSLYIASLLKKKYKEVRPSGSPENALLVESERIQKKKIPAVAELSSWQLEFLPRSEKSPQIALITNLYHDHQNRYKGMEEYADAKANIFLFQNEGDALILNRDNTWWKYFAQKPHRGRCYFISKKPLPKGCEGVYLEKNGMIVLRLNGREKKLFSSEKFSTLYGVHNLENLFFAILAVMLFDSTIHVNEKDAVSLPTPKMRQEIILKKKGLTIVNDSSATSPDGAIVAINRFKTLGRIVLITGGTDKELQFEELAKTIRKNVLPEDTILLEGSATRKLQNLLKKNIPPAYDTLSECVTQAFLRAKVKKGKVVILFSPASASFEKFLHEFDRGEQFNVLIKKLK